MMRLPGGFRATSSHKRVKGIIVDGVITDAERPHLLEILQHLIGGTAETLAAATHVSELMYDTIAICEFSTIRFCLTGDFVYGPRESCHTQIEKRGGIIAKAVTKNLRYLVVGDRGSPKWKHGSFGTKVETAEKYKRDGLPILIVLRNSLLKFGIYGYTYPIG